MVEQRMGATAEEPLDEASPREVAALAPAAGSSRDALHLLQDVSTRLIRADCIHELYEAILDAAVALMRSDHASLQMFDPVTGGLRLLGWRGFTPEAVRAWAWVGPGSQNTCGAALRAGQRVVVADVERCEWMAGSQDLRACLEAGIRAAQTTLLRSRSGALLGTLSTYWSTAHEPSAEDLLVLDVLARQAADLVDRTQAEEALRERDTELRALLDPWVQTYWEAEPDGLVVRDSPSWRAYTGQTFEEMYGYGWLSAIHPDDRAYAERLWAETMAAGRYMNAECRLRSPDGGWRWTNVRASPVLGPDGRIRKWFGVNVDISEHKASERALHETEARQAFLLELMDALRPLRDPVDIQFTAARLLGERLGAQRALYAEVLEEKEYRIHRDWVNGLPSLVGRFSFETWGEEVVAGVRAGRLVVEDVETDPTLTTRSREAFRGLGVAASMGASYRRDGRWVAVFAVHSTRPRAWTPGEIALLGEVAERTWAVVERAQAVAALRESEERLRALVRASSGAIYRMSADWSEMLQLSGADFVTDPDASTRTWLEECIYPDDQATVRAAVDEALRTRSPFALEHRAFRADRTVAWLSSRTVPVMDERGELLEWFGAATDITDRKRAEEELRETDRRKTEFLAVLSHELRNPLAPIRNSIYLLERASPGSAQAERARQVLHRQADHLARLVDDLLDVTRISRGKVELKRARFDLRDVVRKTTDDLRAMYDAAGIDLRVERAAGAVWVDGDATRISQVLGNLLHNSAKFTPAGGAVTVALAEREGRATLSVHDTGAGMEPREIERMFEPFEQGAQDRARTAGGLGLGLSLVKGLVELHGGSVRARSEGVGRGAEFVVTLPLAPPPVRHDRGEPQAGEVSRLVVIVEDNADAAQTLGEILELSGHRVRLAPDARTGLALARELAPDMILCDIGLPDMDGYHFARTVRADPALARTRLVALTGYAQSEDRARALEAGFDAHVAKPPPIEELREMLRGE